MENSFQDIIKKLKKSIIIVLILWLVIDIVLIAPFAVAATQKVGEESTVARFIQEISSFNAIFKIFRKDTILYFLKGSLWSLLALIVVFIIGAIKSKPSSEYEDIEHGSSGWAVGGEQYKVLSKTKGIILSEKNYLPVNKRGNVNILVVGRIWCW